MKVGIISEFTIKGVNYGNKLQAYALNKYLNNIKDVYAQSIVYVGKLNFKSTSLNIQRIKNIIKKLIIKEDKENKKNLEQRTKRFEKFYQNRINYIVINNIKDIKKQNYDIMIVGSDVVWLQDKKIVDKLKFLSFPLDKETKKISYAASFGKNWIPDENKKYIKECLNSFYKISVREKDSINILKSIGISNVVHVCDPTLLLNKEQWAETIEFPKCIEKNEKYIFTYLLGKNENQRQMIKKIAKENKLKIVNIPYADGTYNEYDENFGNINYNDCSIEEWIGLISNAEYIFTDSFHCSIFSCIFEKKFFVISRHSTKNINIRMIDFLKKINQEEKFVEINNEFDINKYTWDYKEINRKINEFKKFSEEYLMGILDK